METSVRIEVPEYLYSAILKEQEYRKKRDGRKTAISDIIQEYFQIGFEKAGHGGIETSGFAQIVAESGGNENDRKLLNDLLQFEKQLKKREESLKKSEQELTLARADINFGYSELHEKQMQVLEFKEGALDTLQKNQALQINAELFQAEIRDLKSKNDSQETQINRLKKEIDEYKGKIIRSLNTIEQQTKQSILKDYILPLTPALITIVCFFTGNRQINKFADLQPIQKEIHSILSLLSPQDAEKFTGILRDAIDRNVKK
jgi:hypothetical protein